jgi:hypothetical protein
MTEAVPATQDNAEFFAQRGFGQLRRQHAKKRLR